MNGCAAGLGGPENDVEYMHRYTMHLIRGTKCFKKERCAPMTSAPDRAKTTKKRSAIKTEAPVKSAPKPRGVNEVSLALGKSVKALRIARDLSQEQLAGEAEIDRTLLSRIERGVANPSLLTLSVICHCLGTSLAVLMAPVEVNAKPSWADPDAPTRRKNRASSPRVSERSRLR